MPPFSQKRLRGGACCSTMWQRCCARQTPGRWNWRRRPGGWPWPAAQSPSSSWPTLQAPGGAANQLGAGGCLQAWLSARAGVVRAYMAHVSDNGAEAVRPGDRSPHFGSIFPPAPRMRPEIEVAVRIRSPACRRAVIDFSGLHPGRMAGKPQRAPGDHPGSGASTCFAAGGERWPTQRRLLHAAAADRAARLLLHPGPSRGGGRQNVPKPPGDRPNGRCLERSSVNGRGPGHDEQPQLRRPAATSLYNREHLRELRRRPPAGWKWGLPAPPPRPCRAT